MSVERARELVKAAGVDLDRNFFTLPASDVSAVLAVARMYGYRKRRDAPGSRARMFWQFLNRGR